MPKRRPELDPEHSLGYQVRRCHRRFDRLLNAQLSRYRLKSGFWYYLRVLWLGDGVTQKYLSDSTNVTENTTVSMINAMVKDGLVERSQDREDRRKMRITLTARGRALEDELIKYAIDINCIAAHGIDPREIEICSSVLRRMSENLGAAFENMPVDAGAAATLGK